MSDKVVRNLIGIGNGITRRRGVVGLVGVRRGEKLGGQRRNLSRKRVLVIILL